MMKDNNMLAEVDATLVSIWKMFHYSPKKAAAFKDMQEAYGEKPLTFVRAATTRWLSHLQACQRFISRFESLLDTVDSLIHETHEPELTGIRSNMLKREFVATTLVLADILRPVNYLSLYLQEDCGTFTELPGRVRQCTDDLHSIIDRYQRHALQDLEFSKCEEMFDVIVDRTPLARRLRRQQEISPEGSGDYSQYQAYQYPAGTYSSSTQEAAPAATTGYSYSSYDYSQTAYASYDGYSGAGYNYGPGYDYSAYNAYYTQTGATVPTSTPTSATVSAEKAAESSATAQHAGQSTALSTQAPPPPPPASQGDTSSQAAAWGADYSTGSYNESQAGYYGSQTGSYGAGSQTGSYGTTSSAYGGYGQPQTGYEHQDPYSQQTSYTGTQQQTGYATTQQQTGYVGTKQQTVYTGIQQQAGYTETSKQTGYTGSQQQTGYSGTQQQAGYTATQKQPSYTGSQQQPGYSLQTGYSQPQSGYGQSQNQTTGSSQKQPEGYRQQSAGYSQGDYGQNTAKDSKTGDNANNESAYYSGIQGAPASRGSYSDRGSNGGGRGRGDRGFGNNRGVFSGIRGGRGSSQSSYSGQSDQGDDFNNNDEFDARNYRDNSKDRTGNDRGRGGRGFGRGGFSDRGRSGSGPSGLRGQWSDDNRDNKSSNDTGNSFSQGARGRGYGPDRGSGRGFGFDRGGGRGFGPDRGGGRGFGSERGFGRGQGSERGWGRGSGRDSEGDGANWEDETQDNPMLGRGSDKGGRGVGGGNRGGFGRGLDEQSSRGSFRRGTDQQRGRGSFGRGSDQGPGRAEVGREDNQSRGGFAGRGRGGRQDIEPKSEMQETRQSSEKPWVNTDKPALKRKPESQDMSPPKKKKEEEKIDVLPFIQAHIEEHCTVNEEARKLAEEALKKMMQPNYCVLCNARMSGPPQAVMHYQGKNHNKKIKNFITCGMTKYAEKVKEDESKTEEERLREQKEEEERNRLLDQKVAEARVVLPVDVRDSDFCQLCCVEFSAPSQAEQHYQGKNHQKRLRQVGPGAAEELGNFVCETCNVRVTSQEILNQHMNGAKHKAKANREKSKKGRDEEYIVPEGGLVVEGGPRLRPGQRVPPGFKVMPYREPTQNEDFTRKFEGPASFFTDNPEPIPPPEEEETAESKSAKRRYKMRQKKPNFYEVI